MQKYINILRNHGSHYREICIYLLLPSSFYTLLFYFFKVAFKKKYDKVKSAFPKDM